MTIKVTTPRRYEEVVQRQDNAEVRVDTVWLSMCVSQNQGANDTHSLNIAERARSHSYEGGIFYFTGMATEELKEIRDGLTAYLEMVE